MYSDFDLLPKIIWVSDFSGHLKHANDMWKDYTGVNIRDIENLHWLDNVYKEDYDTVSKDWYTTNKQNETLFSAEFRYMQKNNNFLWHKLLAKMQKDNQWYAIMTNIHNEKLLEIEQTKNKALLDSVLQNIPVAIIISDANGKLLFSNNMLETIWKHKMYPADNASNYKEWIGFFSDGTRYTSHDWPLARSVINKEVITNEYTRIEKGDGTVGHLYLTSAPVFDKNNKLIAAYVVCHDKTLEVELKKKQNDFQDEMKRIKSIFLSNISHEIKTPISGLSTSIEMLMGNVSQESNQYISIMKECIESLVHLVNNLLDMTKIELGILELDNRPFNIRQVIKECVEKYNNETEIKVNVSDDISETLFGDVVKLSKIYDNILNNAVKFTNSDNREIILTANIKTDKNEKLLLETLITDNGIGFDNFNNFKPFVQNDSSDTKKYSGVGIGLSMSKSYIDLMKGNLSVNSLQNNGTTVKITIPLDKYDNEKNNVKFYKKRKFIKSRSNAVVMIAEDNFINMKTVVKVLEKYGYNNIIPVNNGKIAVDKFTPKIDLILMDCQMPIMDGYTASQKIREIDSDVIIIAFTANTLQSDYNKCISVGMDDYISKPFSNLQLIEKIDYYLLE